MTVFVIGGTGFIGVHVVRRLAASGHDVVVMHRGATDSRLPDGVQRVHADRNDVDALTEALADATPDVVLDVVPYTEAQAAALADACRGRVGRIVAVSSADVYRQYDGLRGVGAGASSDATLSGQVAPSDSVPLTEDAPLRRTRFPYRGADLDFAYVDDYDKIRVEETLRAADVPATICRLAKVYGPHDGQRHVRPYLQRMFDGRPAIVLSELQARWRWSRVYVENAAAALATAVTDERAANQTLNVGEPDALPEGTWVRRLADVVGWTGDVVTVSDGALPEGLQAGFDWRYDVATDTRRIRTTLGFAEPVAQAEALRRTVAWERDAGAIDLASIYDVEDEMLSTLR